MAIFLKLKYYTLIIPIYILVLGSCMTQNNHKKKSVEEVYNICINSTEVKCESCNYEINRFFDISGDITRDSCITPNVACGEFNYPHCHHLGANNDEVVLQRIYCDSEPQNYCSFVNQNLY